MESDAYANILNGVNDMDAGRFTKRICEYECENDEPIEPMRDKEVLYWSSISDVLAEVMEIEMQGKIPKKYNL